MFLGHSVHREAKIAPFYSRNNCVKLHSVVIFSVHVRRWIYDNILAYWEWLHSPAITAYKFMASISVSEFYSEKLKGYLTYFPCVTGCRCHTAVILSNFCLDLSIYLCLSANFRHCKRRSSRTTGSWPANTSRLRVYVIYFQAHCAGVTNMSPNIIYPTLWRYIADRDVWNLATPAKNYTDLQIL